MSLMHLFEKTSQEYPGFRALIAKARDMARDANTRDHLDHLLEQMDKAFAEVESTFPKASADIDATLARARRMNEEATRSLAASKEALLAAAQAAPAGADAAASVLAEAAAPAADAIDPGLALRLREELLGRFADWAKRGEKTKVYREIWEDWEEPGA